jgi:excisionase family DNA binding protein
MAQNRHLRLAAGDPDDPPGAPLSPDDYLARIIRLTVAEVLSQQGVRGSSPLLTLSEVAARAGISLTTVKALVRRGELPVVRFRGHLVRVQQSALESLIDERSGPASNHSDRSP